MFSSVGWGELLVILAAALIILGPERLPGAISWSMQSLRKVRDYATGASGQLRDELGTDFETFREPIAQLNELRQMSPKSVVTKHLLGGDSSAVDELGRTVRETGQSVRDSLDVSGTSSVRASEPAAPAPDLTKKPAAPDLHKEPAARRAHDYTDWDAT